MRLWDTVDILLLYIVAGFLADRVFLDQCCHDIYTGSLRITSLDLVGSLPFRNLM